MDTKKLDLVIRGDLVLSDRVAINSAVGVQDGIIVGLYGADAVPASKQQVDATGQLVFPGIIDEHVHSYSNFDEGFEHSTSAAAAGGVTTIVEMPYDQGAAVTTADIFREKIGRIERSAKVDVAMLATLKKDGNLDEMPSLLELGACGVKLSVFETDPERFPRIDDDVLLSVLPWFAEHGVPVGFHAENDVIIESLVDTYKKEGRTNPLDHCKTRPPVSESLAVLKLLELAHWTKVPLHLYHVSHPRCLELVDYYLQQGLDVTVETCPHYLALSEDDMLRLGAFGKINPPLRSKEAVGLMWGALKDGKINTIASDHAPWSLEKKQWPDIFKNGSGAPGLETMLPLMYSEGVVKRDLSPVKLAQLLSQNPAERFGLAPRKGRIRLGADADFTILDPNQRWTYDASASFSTAKWSPYDGMVLNGWVTNTILRGQTIYKDGAVLAKSGDGKFIPVRW